MTMRRRPVKRRRLGCWKAFLAAAAMAGVAPFAAGASIVALDEYPVITACAGPTLRA